MLQRIFPEGLESTLKNGLKPFYLLAGQDLLLVEEAKEQLMRHARSQEFDEKTEVGIGNDTNWDALFDLTQSNGLFFNRQILLLNLPESPNAAQQKQLAELLSYSHTDLLFILHLPKLTKTMEKQAWFKHCEQDGVLINCQTPDIQKLPNWIAQRAKQMSLQLEPDTVQLLAYNYEGNLLALKQALQLLQLRYANESIGLQKAKEIIEQSAQFTPFQWIDALLAGKVQRGLRILTHLQQEEVQAVVLLRILQKELMVLLEITRSPQPLPNSAVPLFNGNLRNEFDRLKVWQNRRPLYQSAVQRLSYRQLYLLFQQLAELEKQVKQEFVGQNIWHALERLSAEFH